MLKWIGLVSFVLLGGMGVAQARGGSYQSTCENIRQRGPYLTAECQNVDGDYRRTSIDIRRCEGEVENRDGRLSCSRSGGGGYGGQGYGVYGQPHRRYFRAPDRYQDDDN